MHNTTDELEQEEKVEQTTTFSCFIINTALSVPDLYNCTER